MNNICFIFNKSEWKMIGYWTEEELDNTNEKGFIGTKFGIDCYLSRKIKFV